MLWWLKTSEESMKHQAIPACANIALKHRARTVIGLTLNWINSKNEEGFGKRLCQ